MSNLTATYTSPDSSSHTISRPLPAVSSEIPSTDARVAHLADLQSSIKSLQGELNAFLTQKMEEDKSKGLAKPGEAEDEKLEENYGEVAED